MAKAATATQPEYQLKHRLTDQVQIFTEHCRVEHQRPLIIPGLVSGKLRSEPDDTEFSAIASGRLGGIETQGTFGTGCLAQPVWCQV